eukprot:SM000018S03687  [mRNA]  locus=s18:794263:794748:+ [translate_table: standard]
MHVAEHSNLGDNKKSDSLLLEDEKVLSAWLCPPALLQLSHYNFLKQQCLFTWFSPASPASSATLKLSAELVRLFLAELVQRAAIVAETEGDSIIEVSHVERVLPQLLLDF